MTGALIAVAVALAVAAPGAFANGPLGPGGATNGGAAGPPSGVQSSAGPSAGTLSQSPSKRDPNGDWVDGAFDYADTVDCITGNVTPLGDAWVGWQGTIDNPPQVGQIYYVHVYWGIVGNPCGGGAYVHDELFLPAGTQLAINSTHPVRCYYAGPNDNFNYHQFTQNGNDSCPQQATAGMYGGLAFDPAGNGSQDAAWPSAFGTGFNIEVPVKSSAPLTGLDTYPNSQCPSCLVAGVWMIDGVDSPWISPHQGVYVVQGGGGGGPVDASVSYPYPAITDVSYQCSGAPAKTYCGTLHANLFNAPKAGTSWFEVGKKAGDYIYNTNGSSNGTPDQIAIPGAGNWQAYEPWALDPGQTFHWRYCYVPSGGSKVCGADNVYTVQPDTVIANSTIKKHKPKHKGKATFDFDSSPDPSSSTGDNFQCSLDGGKWKGCGTTSTSDPTPHASYSKLAKGSHTFKVRAKDPHGNPDRSPATLKFKV